MQRSTTLLAIGRVAICAMALSGCETYYKPPVDQAAAKVRFKSSGPALSLAIETYETTNCDYGKNGGMLGNTAAVSLDPAGILPTYIADHGNTLGMMGYDVASDKLSIERLIPGDAPFIFSILNIGRMRLAGVPICKITAELYVRAGMQYEIVATETPSQCQLEAFQLIQKEAKVVRVTENLRKIPKDCR